MQESEFRHSERRERATHAFAATVGSGICWVLGSTSILIIESGFRGKLDFELGLPGALKSGFKWILFFFLCFGDRASLNLDMGDFEDLGESPEIITGGGFNGRILPRSKSSSAEEREGRTIPSRWPLKSNSKSLSPSSSSSTSLLDDGGGKRGALIGEERDVISINAGEEGRGGARAGGGTAEEQVDRALTAGRCAYVRRRAVAVVPVSAHVQRRRRRRRHHFRLHFGRKNDDNESDANRYKEGLAVKERQKLCSAKLN
ncbi:LOW QUALITY PROTEIN: hypothetical protein Cgig2_032438 [Carnegiea gigantea]|uniref:Uncharacterized protein n=1 Tax=Carnegiea gigantea TaxID=171969 RepID=A0A9Q1KXQ5_9CARY|nr:LOW QUALITY PROTEIN: hypothetical protein Cgig2_032438 [Carnegiea gigantea]